MKEKIVMRIHAGRGYFDITESGNIIRLDQPGFQPSGQWKLRGIADRKGRLIVPFSEILTWREGKPEMKLKNGKPRYTVADFDHGTNRVWGNADYHGIFDIWPALKKYYGREGQSQFRTMTLDEAKQLRYGQHYWFKSMHGDARRFKVNGAPKTWKRDASRIEIPAKYGMYDYATFDAADIAAGRLLVEVSE